MSSVSLRPASARSPPCKKEEKVDAFLDLFQVDERHPIMPTAGTPLQSDESVCSGHTDMQDGEALLQTSWHHRAMLGDELRRPYWQEEFDIQISTLQHDRSDDVDQKID